MTIKQHHVVDLVANFFVKNPLPEGYGHMVDCTYDTRTNECVSRCLVVYNGRCPLNWEDAIAYGQIVYVLPLMPSKTSPLTIRACERALLDAQNILD